jgi:hypothetical protein
MNGIRREQNSRGLGYRSLRSVGAFTTLVRNCGSKGVCQQFHYDTGSIWGSETAVTYKDDRLSVYGNVTIGRNLQRRVATGQFNFPADELAFIDDHYIVLDNQPLYGASAGASYKWKSFTFSLDAIYSSGLRAGFANLERLPTVVQINAGA